MPGHDPVPIASVHLLADGRSLFLEMPDLQPVNQLHLNLGIADGPHVRPVRHGPQARRAVPRLPNYREPTRPVAAHPILKDLAYAAKREPNPWRKPIPGAREVRLEAGKNLTFATPTIRVKAGEAIRLTFVNPDVVPHNWVLVKPGTLQDGRRTGEPADRRPGRGGAQLRAEGQRSAGLHRRRAAAGDRGDLLPGADRAGAVSLPLYFPGHWMVMNGEMLVE